MNRIRLLPVLVFALCSLLVIRVLSVAMDDRPDGRLAQLPTVGDNFARAIERARLGAPEDPITTASVPPKQDQAPKDKAPPGDLPKPTTAMEPAEKPKIRSEAEGVRLPPPPAALAERAAAPSPTERELLERLKDRRTTIEARDRELEVRDQLLRQTERRLDERIGHLRTLEAQNEAAGGKGDAKVRFRPLVVMYENMKPKEAARVFDRLELPILLELVGHMNPRKLSEIVAVMDPAAAGKLTVAMARQAQDQPIGDTVRPQSPGDTELQRLPTTNRR
jgi:flagellar motility protein MotE (MotC chaperone)